ncbi:MAG: T9SS type A sorting domain-containing protein, partial [Bacteroidia bacterium]|nr:T9SS type A sorting domain-containing protein [Bacteroidia bacterium]
PKTGIPDLMENAAQVLIFPNPFSNRTAIIAGVSEPQQVRVKVQNLVGQVIAQTEMFLQPGGHHFDLSVTAAGIYMVSLTTDQGTTGYRVICTDASGSGNSIKYTGVLSYRNDPVYKSGLTSYTLGYSSGDTILYRCVSGKFTAIFTDSPLESKNYEVEFAPIASFTISPETRTTETRFELNASSSTDAETAADDLEVRWDFDGDGNWDTDYDVMKTTNVIFPSPGAVTIILEVKDAGGLTGTASQTLSIAYPTFTDPRDGNVYPYKRIGNQLWMIRDMAWLPSVSPYSAGSTTDKIYYVVGYSGTNVVQAKASEFYGTYGALYNGVAAQDACPAGWHTATDEEWKILERYLGMTDADLNLNSLSFRNTGNVGSKLKEAGTSHWVSPNNGATNSSGFTALPGNSRSSDLVIYLPGPYALYWTGTSSGGSTWQRCLASTNAGVLRYFETNDWGMSVRCVKD